jgi:hypothetical protein
LSADDFYNIFKSVRGPDLPKVISGALYFRNVQGPNPESEAAYGTIVSRATDALKRIAAESSINRRRVAEFDITIPD